MIKKVRLHIRTAYDLARRTEDSDHLIVEEMVRDYRGIEFDNVPPDPRVLDISQVAALRERLTSEYSYRWREREAEIDLGEALFAGTRSSATGNIIVLKTGSHLKNALDQCPPYTRSPISWGEAQGYRRKYYITVSIIRISSYIHDLGDAEALLRCVFPGFGYAMSFGDDGHQLRLELGGEVGPWFAVEPPARALVIALLERLERHPEEAAAWRSPP